MAPPFIVPARREQAMVEYIVLIGLIILFLIVVLIQFRNTIVEFTAGVVSAIERDPRPPPGPSRPIVTPAQPSPSPSPSRTPEMSPEEWARWIQGNWCGPSRFTGVRTAPGVVNGLPVTSIGPERFRFTNPGNPNDYTDYERLPDGTFRMTYRNLTPSQPQPSAPWRRC